MWSSKFGNDEVNSWRFSSLHDFVKPLGYKAQYVFEIPKEAVLVHNISFMWNPFFHRKSHGITIPGYSFCEMLPWALGSNYNMLSMGEVWTDLVVGAIISHRDAGGVGQAAHGQVIEVFLEDLQHHSMGPSRVPFVWNRITKTSVGTPLRIR